MILRATIFHTPRDPFRETGALETYEDGAICFEAGRIVARGDYAEVRAKYPDSPERDLRGGVLLPGFVDTHIHYPQVRIIGALGDSLLEWLRKTTLPEEARFSDNAYASAVASEFVNALVSNGTTTALVFGAHFAPAVATLFEKACAAGLRLVSGLVLADRSLLPELHQTPDAAYLQSSDLIRRFHGHGRLLYAVTPRFALSCSEAMLDVCRSLMNDHPGVRFQTHMNENREEIAGVAGMFPQDRDYLAVYERFGLAGPHSVFAHNVHASDDELQRLAEHRSCVAYCPASNAALGSGIFPLWRHVRAGVRFALGTDVGAGTGFGMLKEGLHAYLTQRLSPEAIPLNAGHLLYLATRAGAEVLGLEDETGDFSEGKSADMVYIRPLLGSPLETIMHNAPSSDRFLSAIFTLAGSESIASTWAGGRPLCA